MIICVEAKNTDNWVLNQHTMACMDIVRPISTFIKFYLQGILHNMGYFTPKNAYFVLV